jgi:choice-of-anchor C domain-containing protein
MVLGAIVACAVLLVALAVGGAILALRGSRSPGAHDDPPGRRAERDEKGKNLLVNGGFEQGPNPEGDGGFVTLNEGSTAIPGWTVTRGGIDYIGVYWQHAEGGRSLDLNGLARGGVAQTLETTKGRRYRVTFSMAGNPTPGQGETAVKTLGVSAGGSSTVFTFDTSGRNTWDMGWVTRTWDFVASADHTTLEFYSLSGQACGPALDNVSVVALE